jgi:hypothetical protein
LARGFDSRLLPLLLWDGDATRKLNKSSGIMDIYILHQAVILNKIQYCSVLVFQYCSVFSRC